MIYRVYTRDGRQWVPIGLDCSNRGEVLATVAMLLVPGAAWRVRIVGGC